MPTRIAIGAFVIALVATLAMLERPHIGPVNSVEMRETPRADVEQLALKYIKTITPHPESVQPERWGPHWYGHVGKFIIVRVVYRWNNAAGFPERHDKLFLVLTDGSVANSTQNNFGDNWTAHINDHPPTK